MRRDAPSSSTLKIGIEERASLSAPPTLAGWGSYPLRGPRDLPAPHHPRGAHLGCASADVLSSANVSRCRAQCRRRRRGTGGCYRSSARVPPLQRLEVRIPSAPPSSPDKQRWFPDLRKSTPFQWLGWTKRSLRSRFFSFAPAERLERPSVSSDKNSVSQIDGCLFRRAAGSVKRGGAAEHQRHS